MAEVININTKLEQVGEGYRFDGDVLLEGAKGQNFERLAIIGSMQDGSLWVSGTANAGETLILIEMAKLQMLGK